MTVMNNSSSQGRVIGSVRSDLEKPTVFSPVNGTDKFEEEREGERDRDLYGKLKFCGEVETDQESAGSSEDMDSPRSVAKVRRWPVVKDASLRVHSQILRIRVEDLQIGDGIGEGLSIKDKLVGGHHVDFVVYRKPILPASPLGGKTDEKMIH